MLPPPETRYATSGDVHIAYQVVGSGPLDLLMVPGWISNLDVQWEDSDYRAVEGGRWFARSIPGARYVELDDEVHVPWLGDRQAVADEIQEFLTGSRGEEEPDRVLAAVLFVDVVDSTGHLARLGDRRWGDVRARYLDLVRDEIRRQRGVEVNETGDGVMAMFDGPARAVRCALGVREAARAFGIEVRAGVHIGECEHRHDDVVGIAVHTAARVMAAAGPGEVLVSSTVKDLVAGSGLRFEDRGRHTLKGIPGDWQLFGVA